LKTTLTGERKPFNVFNRTNFDGIRLSKPSKGFGRVISTRDPRIMPLALKLYF
jgi:hypothetical protein